MAAGIACENCVAACCRKQTLLLLTDEDVYKNRHQMKLQRLVKAKPYAQKTQIAAEGRDAHGNAITVPAPMNIDPFYGLYILEEDCGHLTEDLRCGIWGSSQRPITCSRFETGSTECLLARAAFGLTEEGDLSAGQPTIGEPRSGA